MAAFDAPSREICAIRRMRTNTPLQAFVTLNDPVYVEAAQALARRIVREGGADAPSTRPLRLALCQCRPPRPEQVAPLVALYSAELDRYRKDHAAAVALATEPLGPVPTGMDAAELAAWTAVANVLLNLDSVLTQGMIVHGNAPPRPPPGPPARLAAGARPDPPAVPPAVAGGPRVARPGDAPRPRRPRTRDRPRRRPGRVDRQPAGGAAAALRRRGRSASSTCTCPAHRRSRTCSTTSPSWSSTTCSPAPTSCFKGQKFAFIKGHPKLLGTPYKFRQYGQSGAVISELLPHLAGVADDLAIIRSM